MLSARRSTIVAMAVVMTMGSLAVFGIESYELPPMEWAVSLLAFPAVGLAWRARRSDAGMRWALVAIQLLAVSTAFSRPHADVRLGASVVLFVAADFGAVALRRRVRMAWLALVIITWSLIVPATPLPLTIGDIAFNARWATLSQLLLSAIWLSWMWDSEIRRVRRRDELTERRLEESVQSLAMRERLRVWRESLVRIHETVLNDIRSVIDVEHVEWKRLGAQLAGRDAVAPPATQPNDLTGIVESVIGAEDVGRFMRHHALPRITFSPERAAALRGLLLEFTRNLVRHSRADEVTISATRHGEFVDIRLQHNGAIDARSNVAGIGLGVVLADALAVLHGTVSTASHVTEIRLPVQPQDSDAELLVETSTWRAVLASGATGLAAGGLPHFLLVAAVFGSAGRWMALAAIVTVAIAMYATWKRRPPAPWVLAFGALTATSVPFMASALVDGCTNSHLPIIVSTLSTVALSATLVWAPGMRWWWLTAGSVIGTIRLAMATDLGCEPSGASSFLALLVAPVLLSIVYASQRESTARANRARSLSSQALLAAISVEASRALGTELHAAVREATQVLETAAAREGITEDERLRLRCLDAEIRATIQVDPESAGGFAQSCRELVHEASQVNIPVRVLTLRDSGDVRPLPEPVTEALRALLRASTAGEASMRVLTSPGEDRLVLTTSQAAAAASQLPTDWQVHFDDGSADLEFSDPDAPAMLMVQRRHRL